MNKQTIIYWYDYDKSSFIFDWSTIPEHLQSKTKSSLKIPYPLPKQVNFIDPENSKKYSLAHDTLSQFQNLMSSHLNMKINYQFISHEPKKENIPVQDLLPL